MTALKELQERDYEATTALEDCILQVAKNSGWAFQETAEKAAAELASLRATIDSLASKASLVDDAHSLLQDMLILQSKIVRAITKLEGVT
jgi:phage tail tape-measure protein